MDTVAEEAVLEDSAACDEVVEIVHMQDMEHIVEAWAYVGIEEAVEGNNSRYMAACSCCTSAEDIAGVVDADVDCIASFSLHLVACLLALPADDGHSSCRLGNVFSFKPIAFCVGLKMRAFAAGTERGRGRIWAASIVWQIGNWICEVSRRAVER